MSNLCLFFQNSLQMHYYLFSPNRRDRPAQQSSSGHFVFKVNVRKKREIKHETTRLLLKRQDLFVTCNSEIFRDSQLCSTHRPKYKLLGLWGPKSPFKAIKTGIRVWGKTAWIWRVRKEEAE